MTDARGRDVVLEVRGGQALMAFVHDLLKVRWPDLEVEEVEIRAGGEFLGYDVCYARDSGVHASWDALGWSESTRDSIIDAIYRPASTTFVCDEALESETGKIVREVVSAIQSNWRFFVA